MGDKSLEALSKAYDVFHSRRDPGPIADDPWHLWLRASIDLGRDVRGRRVLEAGAGRGGFALWLAANGEPGCLVASDFSPGGLRMALDAARDRPAPVGWPAADVALLPFPDATFDTVICCETIEHVLDPPRATRELARVLRPGGRLYLTTPSYLNATGLYRGYLRLTGRRYDEGGQPVANFTMLPRTAWWLRRAGLRIERSDGVGHYLPWPGRSPIRNRDLDARALRPLLKWFALHSAFVARKAAAGDTVAPAAVTPGPPA